MRYPFEMLSTLKPIFHCNAKPLALGSRVGLDLQCDDFALPYTSMLVSRNPCGPNATPNLPNTTPNPPNKSRWNIGHVGSPRVGSRVGHVDFMFLCPFHLRWVANANAVSGGIWAFITITWTLMNLLRRHIKYSSIDQQTDHRISYRLSNTQICKECNPIHIHPSKISMISGKLSTARDI